MGHFSRAGGPGGQVRQGHTCVAVHLCCNASQAAKLAAIKAKSKEAQQRRRDEGGAMLTGGIAVSPLT